MRRYCKQRDSIFPRMEGFPNETGTRGGCLGGEMVAIAAGLQARILDAAAKHLGPSADEFVREVCRTRLNTNFEAIEYNQLTALIKAIQSDAGPILGRRTADALADEILQLKSDVDAGISGRVVGSVARVMGSAADPFLRNVCTKLAISLDDIDRTTLPLLAQAAGAEAAALLGKETAEAVQHAIERSAHAKPAAMVRQLVDLSVQHTGPGGEKFIRDLCRSKLETDLDEIEPDGLVPLADAIRNEAATVIGSAGATAFAQTVAAAVVSPNVSLRAKITDVARKYIGPAGEDFLRRSCRKMGMPWDAVDYEHMMWLAEVVRAESAPLIGKKSADDFARTVRAFLVGK